MKPAAPVTSTLMAATRYASELAAQHRDGVARDQHPVAVEVDVRARRAAPDSCSTRSSSPSACLPVRREHAHRRIRSRILGDPDARAEHAAHDVEARVVGAAR